MAQELLNTVVEVADWVELRFRPEKCACLHLDCQHSRYAYPETTFSMYGESIASLSDDQACTRWSV